jgi:hypothetical protein
MRQRLFFLCHPKDGDENFLAPSLRENDVLIPLNPLPSTLDMWVKRRKIRTVDIIGGFKDLFPDEHVLELERDLFELLPAIISEEISSTIITRKFDERTLYAFYLTSLLSQISKLKLNSINMWRVREINHRNAIIAYDICPFGPKAEIKGLEGEELTKAFSILLISREFPVYPRLLARSWSDQIEAERRRVTKILQRLKEQGLIQKREHYIDYFGKNRTRLTSVPVNAYRATIKGSIALATIGEVEREETNNLAEQVSYVIEQKNLLPRDIWTEDIVPFCPVYDEASRGRLIVSSDGRHAIPIKPEYFNPEWRECSFILIDIEKGYPDLDKKEIVDLLSKLGKMKLEDLQMIYRRRQERGICGPLAFPMSARPWLDDPGETGGPLKEYVDRLTCVLNPCCFRHRNICLVQTPTSQWGFEPNPSQKRIYELYMEKRKYDY